MSRRLAALRRSLDAMPSPVDDRPGLLLRDPFGYAEDVVIVPPPLGRFLRFFDGEHEEGDLAAALHRPRASRAPRGSHATSWRRSPEADTREPAHAGEAYPADVEERDRRRIAALAAAPCCATSNGTSIPRAS